METELTVDQLKKSIDSTKAKVVTQELVDEINELAKDSMLRENYKDNIIGFASVLNDGRYRLPDYINAVRYVSFQMLGSSNQVAYTKTFPERYQRLVDEGTSPAQIASFVGAYNRTQLVQKIRGQTLTPMHILNMDMYQAALNRQAQLAIAATSEKVRCDANNSIMVQLRQPETKNIELDVTVKQDSSIDELRRTTLALAAKQSEMIKLGTAVKDIAHSKLAITDDTEASVVSEQ